MIFAVKVHVTCVAIFFKAYFLKKYVFKYKLEFRCELTIALLILENVDVYFGEKYTLTFTLGGGR